MTVTCHRIVERWGSIPYSLKKITLKSGVILVKQKVVLKRGDTAFEVTKRVLKSKRIHFAYQGITQYGTTYVEAINNIYEKGCQFKEWLDIQSQRNCTEGRLQRIYAQERR